MKVKYCLTLMFLILFTGISFTQVSEKKDEKIIFSFKTENDQLITLSSGSNEKYISFRIISDKNIDFEYPENLDENSWQNFEYSYWLRGGGIQNLGIDLNYVYFTHDNYQYILYQTYFAEKDYYQIGLKIIDLETQKINNKIGLLETQSGSLIDLRNNNKIKEGEDLFD